MIHAGVLTNPRSRRNLAGAQPTPAPAGVQVEVSRGLETLDEELARLAAARIDLLVIDGGDGTVREVLTRAPRCFTAGMPRIAVLPSGKTNVLAHDLGAPRGWTLEQALASAERGGVASRSPLEVLRPGATSPDLRGFVFGAAAYVRASELAQTGHRLGIFNNLSVAATLAAAVLQTLTGRDDRGWRAGERLALGFDGEAPCEQQLFLLLASTLERLPMGLAPFGAGTRGLRALTVEAPPRRLAAALPPVLAGRSPAWLEAAGYRRHALEIFDLRLPSSFVLDGETYPGGELTVRRGAPLQFVTPVGSETP
ncbi:diacylglycerol/lipid kinase family protein [Phenylobacterium deserti]|uniref:diacylglycerol/lipid kinase family protein n=1 Tax=Phenylobacterium deserti TaxID=1914756 RepID=UPI001403FFDC|nr:acylglycerol kinase family protein [Phenylobacterium deserti]